MPHPVQVAARVVGLVCLLNSLAPAATVRYNIVPASNRNARVRTIKTGSLIKYYITVEVLSDTAETDNSGLALFNVNLETDLTVEQPTATEFIPQIRDSFTLFPSLGTPTDDDLIGIGASQPTVTSTRVVTGLGQRGAQDLVNGFLQSPSVEGQFTVVIDADASTATVLTADFDTNGGAISARDITAGPGFSITTDDDAAEDPGDELDPFVGLPDTLRFMLTGGAVGILGIAVLVGLFLMGPWGAALGVFAGSLIGLISLFFGGAMLGGGG